MVRGKPRVNDLSISSNVPVLRSVQGAGGTSLGIRLIYTVSVHYKTQ